MLAPRYVPLAGYTVPRTDAMRCCCAVKEAEEELEEAVVCVFFVGGRLI